MRRELPIHHRRSIRLKGYDYSSAGMYLVTMVTYNRECLFGDIQDGAMNLNELGAIAQSEWIRSSEIRRDEIGLDAFVVMPNHLHGIVAIIYDATVNNIGAYGQTRAHRRAPLQRLSRLPRSLGSFIAGYKSIATKRINQMRATPAVPVWQRNYQDHIIRDERELLRVQEYIHNNPMQWELDKEKTV